MWVLTIFQAHVQTIAFVSNKHYRPNFRNKTQSNFCKVIFKTSHTQRPESGLTSSKDCWDLFRSYLGYWIMPFSGINVSASSSEKKSAFLVFMAMAGYFAVYFGLIFGQTNKLNICLGYIFNFDKLTGRFLKKEKIFPNSKSIEHPFIHSLWNKK